MTKLYKKIPGIPLLTPKIVFLVDWMIILILSALLFMGFDFLFFTYLRAPSLMGGEDGILGLFSYIPSIFVVTLALSCFSASGIRINKNGILQSGLFLQSYLPWSDLRKMELMDDVEFSGRRKSFKVLFLYDEKGDFVSITGNIRKTAKNKIKTLLLQYVPQKFKAKMIRAVDCL